MSDWIEFTKRSADAAPDSPGVYEFASSERKIIYIGMGGSLRERLLSHIRAADPCIANTVRFRLTACANEDEAREKERQYLEFFFNMHRRLPECNDKMP